jgi:hypothetical protein
MQILSEKEAVLRAKSRKIGHTKTALVAQGANIFENGF